MLWCHICHTASDSDSDSGSMYSFFIGTISRANPVQVKSSPESHWNFKKIFKFPKKAVLVCF